MIELRKKRNAFHESIRNEQRRAFKAQLRKKLIESHQRPDLLEKLDQEFWFLNTSAEKSNFWMKEFLENLHKNSSALNLIESVSERVKMLICEHENDTESRMEIRQYLFENIPFLIPPSYFNLAELPSNFVEICLYILGDASLSSQEKEDFVERLNYETINKCLLNYFAENWAEISSNRCKDIMMTFFTEMTQFKNLFKRYVYNDVKFEFLLNLIIQEISELTKVEREIYQMFDMQDEEIIEDFISNTSTFNMFETENFQVKHQENENNHMSILNKSVFLCNLLLLSSIPNYNMKETKKKLNSILNYIYRKFFIQQNVELPESEVEFCICVLITKTIDISSYNHLEMIENLIKSGLNRENSQKEIIFQDMTQNEFAFFDSQEQMRATYDESFEIHQQIFEIFLNKLKLLMLYEASKELEQLKFDSVEKWLAKQMRNEQNNILSLENPDLMSCFFTFLSTVIKNHASNKYNSYDSYRNRFKNQSEDCLIVKIKICKLIGKKGFDQLFQHENLLFYSHELLEFFVVLVEGLKECGDISSSIEVLFFNSEILSENFMKQMTEEGRIENEEEMENKSILFMNSFKSHIFGLCIRFLERSYKFLGYKDKEKLLLNLILMDYLSFEDCRKYVTREEEYKLRKNAFCEEDNFEKDESIGSEGYESSQEEGFKSEKNYSFEDYNEENSWEEDSKNKRFVNYHDLNENKEQQNSNYYDTEIEI